MNFKENYPVDFARLALAVPEMNPRYPCTDLGGGNLFADFFQAVARYLPQRGQWFVYSGKLWQPDPGGLEVMQLCKQLADALLGYAGTLLDHREREEYRRFAEKWQNRRYRETVLKDAAGVYPARLSDFDQDPWLLNCQNGTLDLRTRAFRPHNPGDMLATLAGVNYDPEAASPLWEETVLAAMNGDQELAGYLQKALGYGLTGDTREECFFLLYGPTTRNGKGTLMETYMSLLGGYGKAARPETIALRQGISSAGPSEDIAKLCGARAVNISEPDKQMVLSSALVKTLTGNDTLTARYLHENSFEFRPRFKLFINTNHLPRTDDVTVFRSGRVHVLPFERHFSPEEQDHGLKARLRGELSGVLNWCLEGVMSWAKMGFAPPPAVRAATEQYRQDSDKLARFAGDCLTPDPEGEERVMAVYEAYKRWCAENGHRAESLPLFRRGLWQLGQLKRKRPKGSPREGTVASMLLGFRFSR